MTPTAQQTPASDRIAAAFEHSITWEDDIWRADPVDVEQVHADARAKFFNLLGALAKKQPQSAPARIMLFHGQSGAGKTHLIRALRTTAHAEGLAYFGYAQMTADVANYADFFLRRLINSLEKNYNPHDGGSESGLQRMTRKLVEDSGAVPADQLQQLREGDLDGDALANLILNLADGIVASPAFAEQDLDINIVRSLLYLQRNDTAIDHRVRQYLFGRELNAMSQAAVPALDPNTGEGRAFEIIEALGRIMHTVDNAALVFCIDQVEDLRFFDDSEERFQRAVRDLIQIANCLPTSIVVISCLEDFYGQVRGVVAQSYIDRIEKSGPVLLREARTGEEAKLIIAKRLQQETEAAENGKTAPADPAKFFGPNFLDEFGGLSPRRLLELAQSRLKARFSSAAKADAKAAIPQAEPPAKLISTLAAALGFGGDASKPAAATATPAAAEPTQQDATPAEPADPNAPDYREIWDRFSTAFEAEIAADDDELLDILGSSLTLASREWGDDVSVEIADSELGEDLPALELTVTHASGFSQSARVLLCNRPTQGGGLKRQLDKVLQTLDGRTCFMLRASEFPPSRKNQTAQGFRKFRDGGGRTLHVPIADWERMMTIREFHVHYRNDPGFADWFGSAKLISGLVTIAQMLRLDLLGQTVPPMGRGQGKGRVLADDVVAPAEPSIAAAPMPAAPATSTGLANADWTGWSAAPETIYVDRDADNDAGPDAADQLELDALLIDDGDPSRIALGHELSTQQQVGLPLGIMKRHSAVLGGSGSGKTTLALSIIEQMLSQGIPAVLIDRKGDLCSYANPDVWDEPDDEDEQRTLAREKLKSSIDVAVYTPGRASGRPISITLLPSGINELPGHEQQLLANLSAAALGDMLHLKNSATHQKQSGTLSVALRILGSRYSREVMLGDLINLLEDEDPELTDLTQRMDPSGKLRRDLVAQLDSLRFRNAALFEGGGENLRMDSLLGLGPFAREGRTRLSIIYTGFLGDNENILFWVAQFLSEALRFCQRNPNDELQAVVMFDEADLYIPANAKPATAEPLQSLLKRARSAGLGLMLATQSPGDLDYKSRDQITSWFIGRVREDTALRKLKAAFQSESGLDPAAVLPHQTVGQFHLVQEGLVRALKAERSLIQAEQVPFDRIEELAAETKGQDETQLPLFMTGTG